MLSEHNIIKALKNDFPEFIGDDAAVIPGHNQKSYVVTKDLLIEDTHFRTRYFSPEDLAHKALQVNLSDCAAMGASPTFVLGGIGIPINLNNYAQEFLSDFATACKNAGVIIIGGDTVLSPDKLFLSITVLGEAENSHIKYRSTAKPSDILCVAGDLGYAHVGFMTCEKSLSGFTEYKKSFLRPCAKIKEGLWLGENIAVTSMMDLSDGLFMDLHRLCEASHTAATIELNNIIYPDAFMKACAALSLDAQNTILTGGEDYSLLFTVKSEHYEKLAQDFLITFGYPLKKIGSISEGSGIHFTEKGKNKILYLKPFSHFGEKL